MATQQQYTQVIARIDSAVARIEANQGLTADQEDAFLAQFEGIATRVEAIAPPSGSPELPEEPIV